MYIKEAKMAVRKIVQIDEEKCDGCGICIPDCKEGALEIIDGKAKLVEDVYCDGLGACLGSCPQDAIKVIEKEAEDFDEQAVKKRLEMKENIEEKGSTDKQEVHQCPSAQPKTIKKPEKRVGAGITHQDSKLRNWPVQIKLAPPVAEYFDEAHLLIAADCTPFAFADFHDLLEGKVLLIGCPKLDDPDFYAHKLSEIIKNNNIKKVTVAHMEVPCCFGLADLATKAIKSSGKEIDLDIEEFSISGEKISSSKLER